MSESNKVAFNSRQGRKLVGLFERAEELPAPAVLICHSFTGYKEFKALYSIAQALLEKNISALRIDFGDCIGESEGSCQHMTLSNQVQDALSALDFLSEQDAVDTGHLGVAGHSLGGTTAIHAAGQDARVKAVVSVAALASTKWERVFSKEQVEEWKEKGQITFNSYKRGPVPVNYSFYEDLLSMDACNALQNTHAPFLALHGDHDELLGIKNAAALYDSAHDPKRIEILYGADHLFLNRAHREEMAQKVAGWMEKYLVGESR